MASSAHVVDVSEATFQRDVVEYSMKAPVVVDFWADWCGPCKTLGPILEGIAAAYGGAFRLAKVDVDKSPQLAQYFRAQSIPTVVAIFQGQFIDQFVGALPKAEVERWVAAVFEASGLPLPKREVAPPKDPQAAMAFWKKKLDQAPDDPKALLELGRLYLMAGRAEEAEALLQKIPAKANEYNAARATLALRGLVSEVAGAGGEALVRDRLTEQPDDRQAAYLVACADGARGQFVAALERLIGLVQSAPAELKDKAKAAAAIIFDVAGRGDAEVEALRRKLARLLF